MAYGGFILFVESQAVNCASWLTAGTLLLERTPLRGMWPLLMLLTAAALLPTIITCQTKSH